MRGDRGERNRVVGRGAIQSAVVISGRLASVSRIRQVGQPWNPLAFPRAPRASRCVVPSSSDTAGITMLTVLAPGSSHFLGHVSHIRWQNRVVHQSSDHNQCLCCGPGVVVGCASCG
jgi:hypothetical protein